MVEVLQAAPDTLTHREKLLLVVLAEDANEVSRTTWNSVERPEVLRGAKVNRAQLYAVIKSLIAKGALERVVAGQRNGTAKYRIPPFMTSQCQEIPDTDTPSQGQEIPDTDDPQRQEIPDTDAPAQCQQIPDTDASQCQEIPDLSVRKSLTPTPLNPSTATPLASQQEGPREAPVETDEYGIPTDARPLLDAIAAADIHVRWPFQGNDWFPVLALIQKCGVPALADYAIRAARRADVQSARYFLKGWAELPPLPTPGTERPTLRAVSGGHTPFQLPDDHSVYQNGFR